MKTRILTAFLWSPLLLLVLIFPNPLAWTLFVILVSVIGLWEISHTLGWFEKRSLLVLSMLFGFVLPCVALLAPQGLWWVVLAYLMANLVTMVVDHQQTTPPDTAAAVFSTLYVAGLFSTLVTLSTYDKGGLFLWLVFIAAFSTDTFAYFTGYFLGKHKLCPQISPKKTVEGAVGGLLGCLLCFLLFAYIQIVRNQVSVNLPSLLTLSLVVSALSQLGDLAASIIKRFAGVKDYGRLFPGHGGILDRFDSVLFTAPVIAIWNQIWQIIG